MTSVFSFLPLISYMHVSNAYKLKQFCRKESKFSCRKHSKKITNLHKNIPFYEEEKKARKKTKETHTYIHKRELKIRLVAYEQMKTNRNGSFSSLLVHIFEESCFHLHLCNFTGVNTTVGSLMIALTV